MEGGRPERVDPPFSRIRSSQIQIFSLSSNRWCRPERVGSVCSSKEPIRTIVQILLGRRSIKRRPKSSKDFQVRVIGSRPERVGSSCSGQFS